MIVRYNFVVRECYILHSMYFLCALFIVFSIDKSPWRLSLCVVFSLALRNSFESVNFLCSICLNSHVFQRRRQKSVAGRGQALARGGLYGLLLPTPSTPFPYFPCHSSPPSHPSLYSTVASTFLSRVQTFRPFEPGHVTWHLLARASGSLTQFLLLLKMLLWCCRSFS